MPSSTIKQLAVKELARRELERRRAARDTPSRDFPSPEESFQSTAFRPPIQQQARVSPEESFIGTDLSPDIGPPAPRRSFVSPSDASIETFGVEKPADILREQELTLPLGMGLEEDIPSPFPPKPIVEPTSLAETGKQTLLGAGSGTYQKLANAFKTFSRAGDDISELFGGEKLKPGFERESKLGDFFQGLADFTAPTKPIEGFIPKVLSGTALGAYGLVELTAGGPGTVLPVAIGLGAASVSPDDPLGQLATGTESGLLIGGLKGLAPLSRGARIGAGTGIFGGLAAAEGEDVAGITAQSLIGGGLSAGGRAEGRGLRDLVRDFRRTPLLPEGPLSGLLEGKPGPLIEKARPELPKPKPGEQLFKKTPEGEFVKAEKIPEKKAPVKPKAVKPKIKPKEKIDVKKLREVERQIPETRPIDKDIKIISEKVRADLELKAPEKPSGKAQKIVIPPKLPKPEVGAKAIEGAVFDVPVIPKKISEVKPSKLSEASTQAQARIQERGKDVNLGSGPFHELPNSVDYIIIGADKIRRGVRLFQPWAKEMIKTFGEGLRPYLQQIHKEANDYNVRNFPAETKKKAREVIPRLKHLNLDRLEITPQDRTKLVKTINTIKPQLENIKGDKLTHEEVLEAAQISEELQQTTTRAESLKREAQILKTRQDIVRYAKGNDKESAERLVESIKKASAAATDAGRLLGSFGIKAEESQIPGVGLKIDIVKKFEGLGLEFKDYEKDFLKVDWQDANSVVKFFRKYKPATFSEWIDEFRYMNMLSSPKTHILNALSNMIQVAGLRPITRLAAGGIDKIGSAFNTKRERENYIRQVPAYYKGALNSFGDATTGAIDALTGRTLIERPDINRIPTNFRTLKWGQGVSRALEAGDVFFRTLAAAGEVEALTKRNLLKRGKQLTPEEIIKQSKATAEEIVFRKPLDPKNKTGQGTILSAIDKTTSAIYTLRRVPGVKWFIPFVRTPMNIVKQGIEYSPLGWGTLWKNKNKTEQAGKALIGSMVFAAAGQLALEDKLTWAVPRGKTARELFYASGQQPYSVKIGDTWVSYSRIGPLAYPLAMAASIKYHSIDNPKADVTSREEKTILALAGISKFFSDQSYLQGIGDIIKAVEGSERGVADAVLGPPKQLIPLGSLLRWTSHIIDPIYRKAKPSLSPKAIVENIQKDLPWLSTGVPPYVDAITGKPADRESPLFNAFSPFTIRKEKPEIVRDYWKPFTELQRQRAIERAKK